METTVQVPPTLGDGRDPGLPPGGRRARRAEARGHRRRVVALAMAIAGVLAIGLAAVGPFGAGSPPPASTAGSPGTEPPPAGSSTGGEGTTTGAGADAPPGRVGADPQGTGLPPAEPEGGRVRTGTEEEGCFPDMRTYLEQWHRTGVEPEPCFTAQPANQQEQPAGVERSYNGERF